MSFRNGLFAWCFLAWWIFPIGAFAEGHYRLVRPVLCATGPLTIASGQAHLPILELIPDGTPGNASISAVLAQGMPSLSLNLGEKVKTLRLSLARTNGELPASASMFAEPLYVCLMPGGNRPKQVSPQ